MIGYRGCYRYVREPDLFRLELEPDLFRLELERLARVREQSPNVHVMIPFVRTLWELETCLEMIDRRALGRQRGLKPWVMAEVPSRRVPHRRLCLARHRRRVDRVQRPHAARRRASPVSVVIRLSAGDRLSTEPDDRSYCRWLPRQKIPRR